SGKKYEDLAGDSAIAGDPGLNGWVIELWKDTVLVARDTTSGNGDYIFDNVPTGTYMVQEVVQSGWMQTYPASGTYSVAMSSGSNITGKDFANFKLGTVSGTKFLDFDGDTVKDAGETGLPDWMIILTKGENADTAITDSAGSYSFTGLPAGSYQVTEVGQTGWYQTMPGSGSYTVNVTSGIVSTGNDFGNFEYGTISGTKYWDRDSNAVKDAQCESYLSGIKMVLYGTHTAPDTATTDGSGNFTFRNVPADNFTVTEASDPLWRQTFPANGAPYSVTMTSGLDTSGFLFGNFYMPDTLRFMTFIHSDYNKAARAKQKSGFIKNPSTGNVRFDVFSRYGFGLDNPSDSGRLRIGIRRPDSAIVNNWGWFFYRPLFKNGKLQKDAAIKHWVYNQKIWGLKRVPKTKPVQYVLRNPPTYLNILGEQNVETYFGNAGNHLTAELTTLKTNIAASDLEITPKGFGDLLYVCRDGYSDSMFTGQTIRQIVAHADTALTMGRTIVQVSASQRDTTFRIPLSYLVALDTVIGRINREFRPNITATTKLDTISTNPLMLNGYKGLYKVSYLMRDSIAPVPLAHFDGSSVVEEQPVEFRLDQNYPNPFNPQTVIQFELMVPSLVTLKIYNLLGQQVATVLDNQEMEDGMQAIEFDATDYSSGVYFYRLEATGTDANGQEHSFKSVKKMTLIK
ncbi:MAG: T9SS type A sorting domain-containing protein, partial [Bacteroidetes bacterium]